MTALKDKLTRQKGLLLISLGSVVLLVAAACGGGGDNNGVEPTTVPSGNAGDTLEDETTKKNGDSLVDDAAKDSAVEEPARGSISDLQDVEQLRTLFGQDDGEIRLVLLLSPT